MKGNPGFSGGLVAQYAGVTECQYGFEHAGFFAPGMTPCNRGSKGINMTGFLPPSNMAQRIAEAASAFEQQRTGVVPESVTVVLSQNTLVITLHGALSPAEKALAKTAEGASQVQEFHRHLFANASDWLRGEIHRITGVEVGESTAEVEPSTGSIIGVFASGTTVQVHLLTQPVPFVSWSGNGAAGEMPSKELL